MVQVHIGDIHQIMDMVDPAEAAAAHLLIVTVPEMVVLLEEILRPPAAFGDCCPPRAAHMPQTWLDRGAYGYT